MKKKKEHWRKRDDIRVGRFGKYKSLSEEGKKEKVEKKIIRKEIDHALTFIKLILSHILSKLSIANKQILKKGNHPKVLIRKCFSV